MRVLLKIIKKNLKLLIRSKSSALIIILGPLLVIFLVGTAFDNIDKFSLSIGTYSESYSDLTESFIVKLEQKNFKVSKVESEEQCIDQIKQGIINTCITFPPGLMVESDKINEITFHVDNSKINLVWMVLETISTQLTERSSELSLGLTEDLLNKIDFTKKELYQLRPTITNLKTEVQQSSTTMEASKQAVFAHTNDMRIKMSSMRSLITQKINAANSGIEEVQSIINKTNSTSYLTLEEAKADLNTIKAKVEDKNTTISDWTVLNNLLTNIDNIVKESLDQVKSNLGSSSTKINQIQTTVDKVYDEVSDIQITNATTIVNPITTRIKPVTTEKSYLNYLFPSLVILVIMFISILLSNTLVMMEKHSPAYFRNFITPTRDITFILATYLTNLFLVFLQLIIILVISAVFFKAQVLSAIPMTFLILFLTITFFTFLGMSIGHIFNSEETSTLASISIGSIFLFLSNVILPIESMPEAVAKLAKYNPFVIGESLLRKAVIFQAKFSVLQNELLLLVVYSLVLFLIIWISQKIVRKHLGHRIGQFRYKSIKKKKELKTTSIQKVSIKSINKKK